MKETIKKIIPARAWKAMRSAYVAFVHIPEYFTPEVQSVSYCGFDVFYNRGNSVVERLSNEKVFEDQLCEKLVEKLKQSKNPVLLDIGANIGLISLYALHHVPHATVYAFEPGPKQSSLLEKTIQENKLSEKMFLSTYALSDTAGKHTFYTHPKRDQAKDGLFDTRRGEKAVAIEVETKTLDEWWKEAGKPHIDVVKIDTEGAELLILKGAVEFLENVTPTIYLEIEPSNLQAYPYDEVDIFNFLESIEYNLYALSGVKVNRNNFEIFSKEDTYVATHL